MVYRFGEFELNTGEFRLSRKGVPVALDPKNLQVLSYLLENEGHLVRKQELLDRVWSEANVAENALTRVIARLRKALEDDSRTPLFIETVPTLGYRFIAEVSVEEVVSADPGSIQNEAGPAPLEVTSADAGVPPGPMAPSKRVPASYYLAATAALILAVIAGAFAFHRLSPATPAANVPWQQLTFFTDSAVYPALSPDGRMLAFIRGSDPFFGAGEIYVKILPGGQPVELTHDPISKLAPTFSPDGSRVAYGVVAGDDHWATREVSVLGGDSSLLIPNSTSLTWIDAGKRLLYSALKEGTGAHLQVVTADESGGNIRNIYEPPGKRSMAHHAYLSPDGRWLLIVEMDSQTKILPCRIVPFPAAGASRTSDAKAVGPPSGSCLAGAWSPDGKWLYLSASADVRAMGRISWQLGSGSHIWRQRFPDGEPEQVTFGPTSQEGIAMAPDGKSIITSVGSQDTTVWMHDKAGDHQISSEGNASSPSFSSDGKSLYFLMTNGQTQGEELWVKDLGSEKVERVLPGYSMREYSVSHDGKQIAFTVPGLSDPSDLWVAPTNRRSAPVRISSTVAEDAPLFLPDGDVVFRAVEGGSNFLYRMKTDGSARQKISSQPILDTYGVSPNGRWVTARTPGSGDEEQIKLGRTTAFAVDGTSAVTVCLGYCIVTWDASGGFIYFHFPETKEASYALPVMRDSGLANISPAPAHIGDITKQKAAITIPWSVESAMNPSLYAYTRLNTRRNLYRIPLP